MSHGIKKLDITMSVHVSLIKKHGHNYECSCLTGIKKHGHNYECSCLTGIKKHGHNYECSCLTGIKNMDIMSVHVS